MDSGKSILIVDDHSLILQGISAIVKQIPDISKVYTASSGEEATKLVRAKNFDIYILDIEMPDISGFDLIKIIRDKDPDARIIINTMHEQVWIINKLIKCEVNSIILKSSDSAVVEQAVKNVLDDCSYCCPRFEHISRMLRNGKKNDLPNDVPTKRELDVLKAISKGHSTLQIAKMLNISENTVETHRKQLFLKFGSRNAIDLVMKAVTKGWISIEN
jgi:DNA-binding NarL/FixJ family response regulator